ncbi:MAG: choice-of-anchor Q domain-containing protein [Candidatus Binatia bacterium]
MTATPCSIGEAEIGVPVAHNWIAAMLLVAAFSASPAGAATLTVCASGCDYSTVGAALAASDDGDTVQVSAGTYAEGVFEVGTSITLQGAAASSTTLVGDGSGSVMNVSGESVTLDGVTIRGGSAVGNNGGGVTALGGSLTIRNCAITDNAGPGVASVSPLTVIDTVISGNDAVATAAGSGGVGGGIVIYDGPLTVTGSQVRDNRAGTDGGGIAVFSSATISDSVIDGNTAGQNGGGIALLGTVVLQNGSVTNNRAQAGDGGGIWSNQGDLTVSASTIAGNTALGATGQGGGLYLASFLSNDVAGPFGIENSTVSGNQARLAGAGIAISNQGDSGIQCNFACQISSSTIANNQLTGARAGAGAGLDISGVAVNVGASIVAGNTAGPNCGGPGSVRSNGFNVAGDASCDLTGSGDLPNTDPILQPLAVNPPGMTETMALCTASNPPTCTGRSPAIGLNTACPPPSTDQRGVNRPAGRCDSGAYETGGLGAPEPTPTTRPSHDSDDGCAVAAPQPGRTAFGLLAPLVLLVLGGAWMRARRHLI